MPDHSRSSEAQPKTRSPKPEVTVTPQEAAESLDQAVWAAGSTAAAGEGRGESQATLLRDPRLLATQRQSLARRIGRREGNEHLQRVLAPIAPRLRSAGSAVALQPTATDAKPEVQRLAALRPRVEQIEGNANDRHGAITTFVSDALETLGRAETRIGNIGDAFKMAYGFHADTLVAAGQTAQAQEEMQSAIMGIAVGVTIGLALGPAFEGLSFAAKAAGEFVGELGEWGIMQAAKPAGNQGAFQPSVERPELGQIRAWQTLAGLYKDLAKVSLETSRFLVTAMAAGRALSEIAAYTSGGRGTIPADVVEKRINALIRRDEAGRDIATKLAVATAKVKEYDTQISEAQEKAQVRKLEQDMWVLWISSLSPERRTLLDLDPIENRLRWLGLVGPESRLGVDFPEEWWNPTTDTDTARAYEAAQEQARLMRAVGKQATVTRACAPYGLVLADGDAYGLPARTGFAGVPEAGFSHSPEIPAGQRVQIVDVVIEKKLATPPGPYVHPSIGQDYVVVQPLEGQTYATPE